MTIEIVLTEEQAALLPDGDDLVVIQAPNRAHVGRLDREFDERRRVLVEAMVANVVESRKHRAADRKIYSTDEVLEIIRNHRP